MAVGFPIQNISRLYRENIVATTKESVQQVVFHSRETDDFLFHNVTVQLLGTFQNLSSLLVSKYCTEYAVSRITSIPIYFARPFHIYIYICKLDVMLNAGSHVCPNRYELIFSVLPCLSATKSVGVLQLRVMVPASLFATLSSSFHSSDTENNSKRIYIFCKSYCR